MLSQSDGTNPGSIHYADINASYDIDSLNLLSASFGGYFYKLNVQGDSRTSLNNSSSDILYRLNNHYWMPGYSHHSWNGRLDYEHKTRRKGERLTLSYMLALTRQHSDQENTYTEIVNAPFKYTGSLQTERERFTEHTFQADWLRPLGKGHQLEILFKAAGGADMCVLAATCTTVCYRSTRPTARFHNLYEHSVSVCLWCSSSSACSASS